MSGHRRVKNLDYDDDDYDDGYSDEYLEETAVGTQDLGPEDQEQMRQGTVKVKAALGSTYKVTDQEIQDALWNYYYDVDQSVSYLKSRDLRPPPQPKKPKEPSRFDQAAAAAQSKTKKTAPTSTYPVPLKSMLIDQRFSAADFFRDTPFLGVPEHRRGLIHAIPRYPRGGLLGGAPSKLAALAAARKKQAEEKKAASAATDDEEKAAGKSAAALLDRLTKKEGGDQLGGKENSIRASELSGNRTTKAADEQVRPCPIRHKRSPSPPEAEPQEAVGAEDEPNPHSMIAGDLRAQPSIFAKTMLGATVPRPKLPLEDNKFKLPFTLESEHAKNPFAGPSPDDVVQRAQAKGPKSTTKQGGAKNPDKTVNGVANAVADLVVDEAPRTKKRNLDVVAEYEKTNTKNSANFVVIGHVDHGKSTLMGRLLYDLQLVDEYSVEKLRKEAKSIGKSSFALAWLMDSTAEERARGVTVDIATNHFETEKTRFTILDAPGHRDFIPNMIAGASQADFAILVIDSGMNSFESGLKGQTKEHALLVRSMGVKRIIVAVNKMDTANWSKERFEEIQQQMSAFLVSAGFQQKNIAFVPCAGLTGENIVHKLPESTAPWYQGPTLVEELENSEPSQRALTQPLRLTISDVFRGSTQIPLSISGRIDAGTIQMGDQVTAMPSGEQARIKGIEVDKAPTEWAVAGQIATLHLADIDPIHLRTGDIICDPKNKPIQNVRHFTTKILAFEHILPMGVDVHRGRSQAAAKISKLIATLDKTSGAVTKKKPRVVQPGSVARVEVELETAMPLDVGTRVVVRAEGQTVAAGLVEDVSGFTPAGGS